MAHLSDQYGCLEKNPSRATSGRIFVEVKGDIVPEGEEVFFLQLTGVSNATLADDEAQATIGEDD